MSTYAQNLRRRREQNKHCRVWNIGGGFSNFNSDFGKPIPGVRTQATLDRKARSRARRAERKAREAAAALAREKQAGRILDEVTFKQGGLF